MSRHSKRGRYQMIVPTTDPPGPAGPEDIERAIADAMWAGDIEKLQSIARCVCCCAEHTFTTGCPAYAWGGCRGQGALTREEIRGWEEHYARHHGLTVERFYGYGWAS